MYLLSTEICTRYIKASSKTENKKTCCMTRQLKGQNQTECDDKNFLSGKISIHFPKSSLSHMLFGEYTFRDIFLFECFIYRIFIPLFNFIQY